jgi:hypothetical protein
MIERPPAQLTGILEIVYAKNTAPKDSRPQCLQGCLTLQGEKRLVEVA